LNIFDSPGDIQVEDADFISKSLITGLMEITRQAPQDKTFMGLNHLLQIEKLFDPKIDITRFTGIKKPAL
jgi:hypothetical protein